MKGLFEAATLVGALAISGLGDAVAAVQGRGIGGPETARVEIDTVAGVKELVVTAEDFTFDAPLQVTAGRTRVRMINKGAEAHHVQLVRLEEGHTLADLLEGMAAGGPPPSWMRDIGGPNAAMPHGGEAAVTVDLRPGRHALLCFIPSPDGTPHIMKGMSREIEVVPATTAEPVEPAPASAITLTLRDYGFAFSEAITPGTHTFVVRTDAKQSHEIVVFRLDEGRTAHDVVHWFEEGQEGPPPAVALGGVVGLAPGEENEFTLTFEAGRYAFICFLPDAGDGAPHFVHGMIQDYVVR